ncbi:hypothetical protein TBLA_0A07850 [Henningerozyma blattae CBS 6284]|uniref:Prokaryotic-type class I peptide chain release factors domain-containing protein n=1 Tax=Henningerozyma blattae (strain ATCC 34711 / CBS 6284 / DSM 70876 / NBRC 10599 / NRRL Y-10934 / UCD 77-7) TaxID=1071380 RepID=I2GWS2_HENB6|nr:hypothetical protein TBLA_0A07850 [Tetrapisispora blattae CBS 6284]CCH58574.1 hypothetical protein TBLA_0A07850 [Tetrapisispora blattae CBS 6284]
MTKYLRIVARSFSHKLTPSVEIAKLWIDELSAAKLPKRDFQVRFDRSSGPGGQNVNKVNTKCTITLPNFKSANWIPNEVKNAIIKNKFRYYAAGTDSLVIQSQESRSRGNNESICYDKLISEIKACCQFGSNTSEPTIQKWNSFKRQANEKRLNSKKVASSKKQSRKKDFNINY